MKQTLASFISDLPVFDVHEHHMPENLFNKDVGLIQLLEGSYCGWNRKLPYPLPLGPASTPDVPTSGPGTWKDVSWFLQESGTNAFVRNLVGALTDLYDLDTSGITEKNWLTLDTKIRERHADPAWNGAVMDRARVKTALSDPYLDPLLDARKVLGDRYYSVLRVNAFALGWHPEALDHNGNNAHALFARLGIKPGSFEEYLEALPHLLDAMPGLHKVGIKSALAYDRSVDFNDLDMEAAKRAWGKREPGEREKKAFGDVVIDKLCTLAGERDIPFQMHLGVGSIRGARPLNAAALIERHPSTRFLLMHLGYPWSNELLGMAFIYHNIWIDLTWSWLISPTRFKSALHEAIEVLPDESRMMLGGDTWHVEEAYGAITGARRLVSEVLGECIREGQFPAADAERLARRIFHDNAAAFFGLRDK
jgi:hypothetical protein